MPFRGLRRKIRQMGGGGSHHETHYNYVDHTLRIIEENRQREQARLEAERLERERVEQERIAREAREAAERERQRYIAEQQRIREAEAARERQRIQQEQRRLETERQQRLKLEAESSTKRQALRSYKFGGKKSLGYFSGLNISDMKKLRIGVFGPTGSGKSCFINTCERTVRQTDKGSVPVATSGAEGTIILEDYLQELFFRLVDTRGFFSYDHHEGRELSDILFGRIRSGDFIQRSESEPAAQQSKAEAPFDCWLHGVILVVKANDIRLKNGTLEKYLRPVRETLKPMGISPVTVVTHRDTLTSSACEQILALVSQTTGSTRDHIFFLANYCPDHPGPDVNTELKIYNILHYVLLNAEEYVKNAKQNRAQLIKLDLMNAIESATAGHSNITVPQAALSVFLDVMKTKYKWPDSRIQDVSRDLHQEDVKTLHTLASCWTDIRAVFPTDMRTTIERDLSKMRMI